MCPLPVNSNKTDSRFAITDESWITDSVDSFSVPVETIKTGDGVIMVVLIIVLVFVVPLIGRVISGIGIELSTICIPSNIIAIIGSDTLIWVVTQWCSVLHGYVSFIPHAAVSFALGTAEVGATKRGKSV